MNKDILIVDDEDDIRNLLTGVLEDEEYECQQARNSKEVFEQIEDKLPSLVLLDVWLEGSKLDGIGILKEIIAKYPDLPVVMMSGHSTIETAVSAIKLGAYDFIEKPFDVDIILMTVNRALEVGALKKENRELKAKANNICSEIHGGSQQINNIRNIITKVALTDSRVFITGKQGTGKNVVARMIHKYSNRSDGKFLSINCATINADEIEIALLGVMNNDGSVQAGMFESATGGTLLLDEITSIPTDIQAKLVRVLQENSFSRVGTREPIELDVRLITASSRNICDEIAKGNFREDLYYRLNLVTIDIPSLAERKDDIEVLVNHFLSSKDIFDEHNIHSAGRLVLSDEAMAVMRGYSWPGNVRQLKNIMEWLIIMYGHLEADKNGHIVIQADMLPPDLRQLPETAVETDPVIEMMTKPLREAREMFERRYLLAQIERFDGNISKTAGFIGMERSALHRKLKLLLADSDNNDKTLENNKNSGVAT